MAKVFFLDGDGNLAGEAILDDECWVTYEEFVAALPEGGLGNLQSMFLGEYVATALGGEALGVVLVTRGTLQPAEKDRMQALATAFEGRLPDGVREGTASSSPAPDDSWKGGTGEDGKADASEGARDAELEEAKRDIDLRVKIIQRKAMELLDLQERLKRWAQELMAREEALAEGE